MAYRSEVLAHITLKSKFNDEYFQRLRRRVELAGQRGMYVSVMFFQGFSLDKRRGNAKAGNAWHGHPFNKANNVNGIDGNPSRDDSGHEVHELKVPEITRLQEAFVRQLAERIGLAELRPNTELTSTGFCLATPVNSGGVFRCAVYLPRGGEATVDLTEVKGPLTVEWIEAKSNTRREAAKVQGGNRQRFVASFTGPAILCLIGTSETSRR